MCISGSKFLRTLDVVVSADPCGLTRLQGIARRPLLDNHNGRALGTLLCFATHSEKHLEAKLPRVAWFRAAWEPCSMVDIMRRLSAKRMGSKLDEIDILPHKRSKPSLNQHREPAAKPSNATWPGPCFFGCANTYRKRRGAADWRRNPSNSPWVGMPTGATLCCKCYWRTRDMIRRKV